MVAQAKRKASVKSSTKAKKEAIDSDDSTIESESGSRAEKVKKGESFDLVVVESPSKAKTIKKYLGRGYQVIASNGHIKDLPKSKLGVDVKKDFEIDLVHISGKNDKIQRIKELGQEAKRIYLAPDPDREGEAIAFHLAEEIGKRREVYRVLFNAVTKKAVQAAIAMPTKLDQAKYDSQKTRRVLDRLVGYKISPLLWEKIQRGLSAGRVQSVALRIIVEREDEIKAFKPEQWFSIEALLSKNNCDFLAKYYGEEIDKKTELKDEVFVKKILNDLAKAQNVFNVIEVRKKERKQNPTPPFTTSKLQQEAANKLGFSTKKTMMIAQGLYEGVQLTNHGLQGLITYMRTDSVRTEPEALTALRDHIRNRYGDDYLAQNPIIYKKKGGGKVQDAHEAIRPANLDLPPEEVRGDLDDDQLKLYTLIWNKFVSSQMSPAVIDQTTVILEIAKHFFRANGSVIKFPGFRTVYLESFIERSSKKKLKDGAEGADNDEDRNEDDEANSDSGQNVGTGYLRDQTLPPLDEKEKLPSKNPPKSEEHWTSPPPRYSEASIVKELEEQGIGRPSTYSSIISNISDRGYVEKRENRFFPTELGITVCRMLIESFPEVMDIAFTARIEELLDKIEEGDVSWKRVLADFWKPFEEALSKAKGVMQNLKKQQLPTGIKCLKCQTGEYHIKWGKNGQFLACSNYPDCTSTEDFKKHLDDSIEIIPKKFADKACPICKKRMVITSGRYGRFLACEDYPNCKGTSPFEINVVCSECKTGKYVEKKSRYGKLFYGCSNYPTCSNALWSMPYQYACKKCGNSVMCLKESKKNGKELQCPKCRYTVPLSETPFDKKDE